MKQIFALLVLLAVFASAQTDSTDILITVREDGDTTTVGRWRAGMPVVIRDSWDGWGEREKQSNKFVIIRVGITKARIDTFLAAHTDSTIGLRRKYQLSRAAIQFVKNNRDQNNIVRVTPAQLRNAFKRANQLRRFSEPQRMGIIPDRLYVKWRNMLIGATATSVTVNTDGGGDYTSLAAAEAGEQKDLVTANEQLTINCSGTTADVNAVVFDGWTTDATRNIVIQGDNNTGVWGDGYYTLRATGNILYILQPNTLLNNMQIQANSGFTRCVVAQAENLKMGNCVIKHLFGSGAAVRITAGDLVVFNSCFIGDKLNGNNWGIWRTSGSIYVYNSIIYNFYTGFEFGGQIVRNVVTQSCLTSYNGVFTGDYNCDDNNSAPGANSLNSTTVNFADAANGDFRLLAGSPGIDQGVDLSSDPNYPFDTAIDGTIRPQGAAWDIGAFEYVAPTETTVKKNRFNGFGNGFNGGWKK